MNELKDRVIGIVKSKGFTVIEGEHTPEQLEANNGEASNYVISETGRTFTMNNWYIAGMVTNFGLSADVAIAEMIVENFTK